MLWNHEKEREKIIAIRTKNDNNNEKSTGGFTDRYLHFAIF